MTGFVVPNDVTKRAGSRLCTQSLVRFLASTSQVLMIASFIAEHLYNDLAE
jgi:hypothetical protein